MKIQHFFILPFIFAPILISAQTLNDKQIKETINVYLDCRGCDSNYLRSEIDFVNFVRDISDAQLHLMITMQRTGSRGWEFTLNYIGINGIRDKNETFEFISPGTDTNDEMRKSLLRHTKLGLIYFLTNTKVFADLDVEFTRSLTKKSENTDDHDPWNSWIFRVSANTNFSGEQSRKNFRLGGNVDIRRITDDWKINFRYDQDYNMRTFRSKDSEGNSKSDTYITENQSFFGLMAHSLSDHWTAGAYTRAQTSTQNNIDLSVGATPSIEYSLFPYHEFSEREITFRYGLLGSYYDYTETTIFNKEDEFLWRHELSIRADFTKPWGGLFGWVEAGTYLHDVSLNRMNIGFRVNMRIARGLSVFLSSRYSVINDQLSLAAGETTEEELLLNLRQQATSYNYGGSVGIEFNFGSIYNNIVNPRF